MYYRLILIMLGIYLGSSFQSACGDSAQQSQKKRSLSIFTGENERESKAPLRTWNPFRAAVLRLKATEPRFLSGLNREKRPGSYFCAGCGKLLFSSADKYESGSGWPSFTQPVSEGAVALTREWDGRTEVRCSACGGHQGHFFPDGPSISRGGTGNRYCVNGLALSFVAQDESAEESSTGSREEGNSEVQRD